MTYRIPFGKPLIGEEEKRAALLALDQKILTNGPRVQEFEAAFGEFVGGHAVAVSSCFAALHLAFLMAGRGRVYLPALTHQAALSAAYLAGRKWEFVDCGLDGNMPVVEGDVVCTVNYLGKPCEPQTARYWIEDCALGGPARGRFACYSFYPIKHITTGGDGGMLVCQEPSNAAQARSQRSFGYGGFNYRMSEVQAAIGMAQLAKLPKFLEIRAENYFALKRELDGFEIIDSDDGWHYALAVIVESRDKVRAEMETETSVYYNPPLYFARYASDFARNSITLPVGPHLNTRDMKFIAEDLKRACHRAG